MGEDLAGDRGAGVGGPLPEDRKNKDERRHGFLDESNKGFTDQTIGAILTECSEPEKVSELDLSGNLLEAVPAEVSRFSQLRVLTLDGNRVRTIRERSIPDGVVVLNIRNNCLQTVNVESRLPGSLRELHVSGNKLVDISLGQEQSGLLVLSADDNRLKHVKLSNLCSLQHLDLSGNCISRADVSGAPLKILNLSRNELDTLCAGDIGKTVSDHVEVLDLSSNALIEVAEDAIPPFIKLKRLNLQNNAKLTDIPVALVTLAGLEELELAGCAALKTISPDLLDHGFPVVRAALREKLLQQALNAMSKRLKKSEQSRMRIEQLRRIREEEILNRETVTRSQAEGEMKLRIGLETAAKSLKAALRNERSKTETLLLEKEKLLEEVDNVRRSKEILSRSKMAEDSAKTLVLEQESELKVLKQTLSDTETHLRNKIRKMEEERKRWASHGQAVGQRAMPDEVESLRKEVEFLRTQLREKEQLLEGQRVNSSALENNFRDVRKTASDEIKRLHEKISLLEKSKPKNGLTNKDHSSISSTLAAETAKRKAVEGELANLQLREQKATERIVQLEHEATFREKTLGHEIGELELQLKSEKELNSRWLKNASALDVVERGLEGDAAIDSFIAKASESKKKAPADNAKRKNSPKRSAGGSKSGSATQSPKSAHPDPKFIQDALEDSRKKVTEWETEYQRIKKLLEDEESSHVKTSEKVGELSGELARLQSEMEVSRKEAENLRSQNMSWKSENAEILELRKEISTLKAFGDEDGSAQNSKSDHKIQALESALHERSAELQRIREVLKSKEHAVALLEANESQLHKQSEEKESLLKSKQDALLELNSKIEMLTISRKSLEQRATNSENISERIQGEISKVKRTLEQVTADRDSLRQKKAFLEASSERQKEEISRCKSTISELGNSLNREAAELARTRKALSTVERRSAEQESALGKRGAEIYRLEAIQEEQRGKLRWKDSTLEALHERLATEKILAASRLDEINTLTTGKSELNRELSVTTESLERAREMVAGMEERLTDMMAAKERRDSIAEEASGRAEHALSQLRHVEEQLRAAGEVAAVRNRALNEHSDVARRRVMELTEESEKLRWNLRDAKEKLNVKTREGELHLASIASLEQTRIQLENDVSKWTNTSKETQEELKNARQEISNGLALIEWKENEISTLNKGLSDTNLKLNDSLNQLDTAISKLRTKDSELTAESRRRQEIDEIRDKLSMDLQAKVSQVEKLEKEVDVLKTNVSDMETKLQETQSRYESESYVRKEAEIEASGAKEKIELLSSKLSSAEGTLSRKTELLKILEESTNLKEGEHTSTLTRLRELEREFSERGLTLDRLEVEMRATKEDLTYSKRHLEEKQEECRTLQKQVEELLEEQKTLEDKEKESETRRVALIEKEAKLEELRKHTDAYEEDLEAYKRREEELYAKLINKDAENSKLEAKLKDADHLTLTKVKEIEHTQVEYEESMKSKSEELEIAVERHVKLEGDLRNERQKVASLEGEIAAHRDKLSKAQSSLEEAYKEKAEQKALCVDAEGMTAKLNVELNMTKSLLKTAEEELAAANSRISVEQREHTTNSSSVKVLKEKIEAKEESVAQLQRYSKFVNSKLQETEKALAEKQQQLEGMSTTVTKFQSNIDALTKSLEDKESALRATESSRIDQVSGLKSRARALEELLEQSREEVRQLMDVSATDALRDEMEVLRMKVRERDERLTDLRQRMDSVALEHENSKQETFDVKENLRRTDNELIRAKARIVELEESKQSLDSGSRLQLHELQKQMEALGIKVQRTESDLSKANAAEEKWRILCEKMKPIVQRSQELEGTIDGLEKELVQARLEIEARVSSHKSNSQREIDTLVAEVARQSKLVQELRVECAEYSTKYRSMGKLLADAIKAGYVSSDQEDLLPDEVLPAEEPTVQPEEPTVQSEEPTEQEKVLSDNVQVTFVLEGVPEKEENESPLKFVVVGGDRLMGSWSVEGGCPMTAESPTRHRCEIVLPRSKEFEYKFVCMEDKKLKWELGSNRGVTLQTDADTLEVHDRFSSIRWQ